VIGENRIQVTAMHRIGPALDERPDLCRVVTHVTTDHGRPANSSLSGVLVSFSEEEIGGARCGPIVMPLSILDHFYRSGPTVHLR
jgi:hypothetical protein